MGLLVDSEVLRRQIRGALKNTLDQTGPVGPEQIERVACLVVAQLEAMDAGLVPRDHKREGKIRLLEQRDGPGCFYCRVRLEWFLYTFDHFVPRCRGGGSGMSNLRLACRRCNGLKGSMDGEAFLASPVGIALRTGTYRKTAVALDDDLAERRAARRRQQGLTQPVAAARGAELLSGFVPVPAVDDRMVEHLQHGYYDPR